MFFLCEFDPLREGLPVYRIGSKINDTMKDYDDGREYILVNGTYEGEDRIGRLVHDLRQTDARNMVIPELREIMKYYKESKEGAKEMCEIFEGIARRERIETNVNAIRNVMKGLNYTLKQAMSLLKIPENEIDIYYELISK